MNLNICSRNINLSTSELILIIKEDNQELNLIEQILEQFSKNETKDYLDLNIAKIDFSKQSMSTIEEIVANKINPNYCSTHLNIVIFDNVENNKGSVLNTSDIETINELILELSKFKIIITTNVIDPNMIQSLPIDETIRD